ncbi:mitochondrial carrier [Delitschia confertaspora ATCC 74209]|uniref:Mitochondrial aspartate-glutamate transporter AGC1 n=1 Tax=Delitschia confertaspora ATCC 74209 TaxID=1513339 RepID=A0A9P4JR88_9PLEO|nr:mitochondrial carrier [Delitschia confertaspora ATCC 74209]
MASSVKEQVSEVLLGSSEAPQLSQHTRAIFMKHAKKDEEDGEFYLGENEFIEAVAPESEDYHKIKRYQYGILFRIADRRRTGRVTLQDWGVFENLLAKPDAEYEIAFRLFDLEGTGLVNFENFQKIYNEYKGEQSLPFNWDSEWASLYIGAKGKRHTLTYPQFSQMLRGLQGERVRQAFLFFDKNKDGYIDPEDFQRIIVETAGHKLSDHLLNNLPTLCNISAGTKISYANVRAFQNMIHQMDMVELIIRNAASKSSDGKITRTDFLNEAAKISRFNLYTPMEADILFHFAGLDEPSGRLGLQDFARVLDPSWHASHRLGSSAGELMGDVGQKVFAGSRTIMHDILESAHHFALGSLAGAFGAFMVYPIDLVKTRMQNQRSGRVGEMLYKNSLDCAKKVIKNEGFKGLYSGVLPQLVGVAPEKAIKLTVNDLVRGKFTDKQTGKIWWPWELLAGGSAGACQVVFTNPLEIVKIRLQVQGEMAKSADVPRRSAVWIMKNLGLVGLYKGASACLLRDVPFSAIYFPTYSHLKRDWFGESPTKSLGVLQMLTAGAIAGMPAAYFTTPCDVIKTRLQVEARKGETSYTGLRHAAKTIYQQEGFKAFFKGGPARILRSSPQFGFTLAGYEVLQKALPMPGHSDEGGPHGHVEPGVGLSEATAPLPYLRSRNALKILLDLDENFGRPQLPRGKTFTGIPGFGGKGLV